MSPTDKDLSKEEQALEERLQSWHTVRPAREVGKRVLGPAFAELGIERAPFERVESNEDAAQHLETAPGEGLHAAGAQGSSHGAHGVRSSAIGWFRWQLQRLVEGLTQAMTPHRLRAAALAALLIISNVGLDHLFGRLLTKPSTMTSWNTVTIERDVIDVAAQVGISSTWLHANGAALAERYVLRNSRKRKER